MANVLIEEQTLKNIADSIRAKNGKTEKMLPSEMATEIDGVYEHGYEVGHNEGLASRRYETWRITLVDGSVIEKEVALL